MTDSATETPIDDVQTDETQGDSTLHSETFTDASGNVLRPTATDALGVDRIVGPAVTDWQPAPVEPDEDAVAAHEEFLARRAASREQQLGLLTDTSRVDETAQPLIDANAERDSEHQQFLDSGDQDKVATTSGTPASQDARTAEGKAGKTGDAKTPKGEAKATGTTSEAKADTPDGGDQK